jgi:hypothetical protein
MVSELASFVFAIFALHESKSYLWIVSLLLVYYGAYRAWDKKRLELQKEVARNLEAPEITAEMLKQEIRETGVELKTVRGGTAYKIRISVKCPSPFLIKFSTIPHLKEGDHAQAVPTYFYYADAQWNNSKKSFGGIVRVMAGMVRRDMQMQIDSIVPISFLVTYESAKGENFEQLFTLNVPPSLFKEITIFRQGPARHVQPHEIRPRQSMAG